MSQTSTATSPSPSATQNGNNSNQAQQTNIPTSTVSAIGGGFIAFAISILITLTFVRMFRVYRDVRRRQRNGEDIQFSREWHREGGFWGFLTGMGGRGGVDALVGAGGRRDLDIWRIYEQYGLGPGRKKEDLKSPELWEVEVPTRDKQGVDNVEWQSLEPMSISSKKDDSEPDEAVYSKITMAVLVLMPTRPDRTTFTVDDEEFDDLPEIVIGTMNMLPTISSDPIPATTASSAASGIASTVEDDKGKAGEEAQVEYVEQGPRRAKWQTQNGKWGIEGL